MASAPLKVIFLIIFLIIVAIELDDQRDPSFKVESVSASVDNNVRSDDSQVTVEWNIGFSDRYSNRRSSFDYKSINVWVMGVQSQNSLVAVLTHFHQGHKNTTFLNATFLNATVSSHSSSTDPRFRIRRDVTGYIWEAYSFRSCVQGYEGSIFMRRKELWWKGQNHVIRLMTLKIRSGFSPRFCVRFFSSYWLIITCDDS